MHGNNLPFYLISNKFNLNFFLCKLISSQVTKPCVCGKRGSQFTTALFCSPLGLDIALHPALSLCFKLKVIIFHLWHSVLFCKHPFFTNDLIRLHYVSSYVESHEAIFLHFWLRVSVSLVWTSVKCTQMQQASKEASATPSTNSEVRAASCYCFRNRFI